MYCYVLLRILMNAMLVFTQGLDTLERWVTQKFSGVPNRNMKEPSLAWWGKIRPYPIQTSAVELQVGGKKEFKIKNKNKNKAIFVFLLNNVNMFCFYCCIQKGRSYIRKYP